MRITLLGSSSSIGSLILETIRSRYGQADVTIIENVPRSDNAPFAPEGLVVKTVHVDALQERPTGPFLLCMARPQAKRDAWRFFSARFGLRNEELMTLVSPQATLASSVTLGAGVYVEPGAVVSPFARVGEMVTINRGSTIGHHTRLDDFVNIGPGCHVSGHGHVGAATQLGVGAVVFDHVRIGEGTLIGGGSVVVKDVPSHVVAWGNPCTVMKDNAI